MAIERKADTSTKIAVAGDQPKAAPKQSAVGTSTSKIAQLRADLSAARRDLALNKLDSPAKIRKLRKDLARALTAENAAAKTKEAA